MFKIAIWADYTWCYFENVESYSNYNGKSDDYIVVEVGDEPNYEQLVNFVDSPWDNSQVKGENDENIWWFRV